MKLLNMEERIIKPTTSGQISIPASWRRKFGTDSFLQEIHEDKIVIKPVVVEELGEEVIFDAQRDNGGRGVTTAEMLKLIEQVEQLRNKENG